MQSGAECMQQFWTSHAPICGQRTGLAASVGARLACDQSRPKSVRCMEARMYIEEGRMTEEGWREVCNVIMSDVK